MPAAYRPPPRPRRLHHHRRRHLQRRRRQHRLLHGEDHLRSVTDVCETPAAGVAAFQNVYDPAARPGPATSAERRAAEALKPLPTAITTATLRKASKNRPPDHGLRRTRDHRGPRALLEDFVDSHRDWEKYHTRDDNCSYAIHESLALRAEPNHKATPLEAAWQIAAHTPPSAPSSGTPTPPPTAPVAPVRDLLENAADHLGAVPLDSDTLNQRVTRTTDSLTEAGWRQREDSRWITWTAPDNAHGFRLDTYAITHPDQGLRAWTAWASPPPTNRPGPSASPPTCRPTYWRTSPSA